MRSILSLVCDLARLVGWLLIAAVFFIGFPIGMVSALIAGGFRAGFAVCDNKLMEAHTSYHNRRRGGA